MDPETKKLLVDTFALAKENNEMIHSMRRNQKWASLMRGLYWLTIIAISVGSYYFIQPYVDQVQRFMKESGVTIDKIKSVFPNK